MNLLEHLNAVNEMPIYSIESAEFAPYGKILRGYDFSRMISFMEDETKIPENGNVYTASLSELESFPIFERISRTVYGGMPIQAGFCNGRNSTFNGFEWHKGSEINVAVTDCALALGLFQQIQENHFDNKNAKVFFVPKGCAIELFQTTLHLSPLRVTESGFKMVVILPRGTNTPLTEAEKFARDEAFKSGDSEQRLLLQRNKWVIAHKEREPLIKQGAFAGIIGENTELRF